MLASGIRRIMSEVEEFAEVYIRFDGDLYPIAAVEVTVTKYSANPIASKQSTQQVVIEVNS